MSSLSRPLMKVSFTAKNDILLRTSVEHGTLHAEIMNDDKENLRVMDIQTDRDYRRRGITSSLITSTIKGAFAVQDKKLQKASFQIINPVVVRLLSKTFQEAVEWYAELENRDAASNGIDLATAQALAFSRQEQAEAFAVASTEFPDDFDPGVYAVAKLDEAVVSQWLMPNIVVVGSI